MPRSPIQGPAPQLPPLNIPGAAPPRPPMNAPGGAPQLPPLSVPGGGPQLPPLNIPGAAPQRQPQPQAFPAQPAGQLPQAQPGAPAALAGRLRPVGGNVGTEVIVLPKNRPFRIGRDSQAELWLYDERISRAHARIDFFTQPLGFVVRDLGSRHGVYVNGQRISAPVLLRAGDRIDIGNFGGAVFVLELAQQPALAARPARV